MSIFKAVVGFGLIFPGLSAFAIDQGSIEKSFQLNDGATVHLFKDGRWPWKINSDAPAV
ncbi:CopK family periplasmic copper-binding protein [Polaromonas sp. CG_9.11]|uniref:CopK family periplasmic copper-binding protein n=1 Tax=Polaromonas sp. CG_9.11 TaxID=2787730 RepID=UPI001E63BE36|nr:CopK family periplasmic copper-binding protein [Polaromonas sp. CG_9.11]